MRFFLLGILLLPLAATAQTVTLGYGTTRVDDTNAFYAGYEGGYVGIYYGADIPAAARLREVKGNTTTTTTHFGNIRVGYYLVPSEAVDIGFGGSVEFYREEVKVNGLSKSDSKFELKPEINALLRLSPGFNGYLRATGSGVFHLGVGIGF